MRRRIGISNAIFVSSVIALIIIAAGGFGLYVTKPSISSTVTVTTTQAMTETMTETMTHTMNETSSGMTQDAIPFVAQGGRMIHNAWLLIEPTGHGQYALTIHVEDLKPSQGMGDIYLVEGVQSSGSMASVPITGNATTSEFEVGSTGVGQFFALLNQNPYSGFENVQVVFLPEMHMSNATVVATASLGMTSG